MGMILRSCTVYSVHIYTSASRRYIWRMRLRMPSKCGKRNVPKSQPTHARTHTHSRHARLSIHPAEHRVHEEQLLKCMLHCRRHNIHVKKHMHKLSRCLCIFPFFFSFSGCCVGTGRHRRSAHSLPSISNESEKRHRLYTNRMTRCTDVSCVCMSNSGASAKGRKSGKHSLRTAECKRKKITSAHPRHFYRCSYSAVPPTLIRGTAHSLHSPINILNLFGRFLHEQRIQHVASC